MYTSINNNVIICKCAFSIESTEEFIHKLNFRKNKKYYYTFFLEIYNILVTIFGRY